MSSRRKKAVAGGLISVATIAIIYPLVIAPLTIHQMPLMGYNSISRQTIQNGKLLKNMTTTITYPAGIENSYLIIVGIVLLILLLPIIQAFKVAGIIEVTTTQAGVTRDVTPPLRSI